MKKFMALILMFACAVGLIGCADPAADLQNRFPEYHNLDTSEGIAVYVWQTEDGEYRCGALSGAKGNHKYEEIAKIASNSTTIDEMKTILASYNIERGYISVYHIEIMSFYYEEIEDYNDIRDIFWGE